MTDLLFYGTVILIFKGYEILKNEEDTTMKKIKLALLVMLALATMMLTACGKKCDLCGDYGADKELLGVNICDDCASLGL